MTKSVFLMRACFGLSALLALSACSRTETALVEEPETATLQETEPQPSAQTRRIQPDTPARNPRMKTPAKTQTAATPTLQIKASSQRMPQNNTAPKRAVPEPRPTVTPLKMRRCMNMGNALEAPNEGDWGYTIRAQDFRAVATAGFDTVRIPIRWDAHTAYRAPYKIDPVFMARVKQVTNDAQAAGLGVIINVHHYEDLMVQTNRHEARYLAIWSQISEEFAGAPDDVYFELLNEPTLDMSPKRLNALYAKTVPLIRKTNPSRKLIMGGNSWNSVEALAGVRFPDDPNIIATFHDYGPHNFTHQGAAWMSPVPPMGRKWGGREDEAELDMTYAAALAFTKKTGLPILVGEFGVIDTVPQKQRNQWTKRRRMAMEARGYAWCAWDFSGAFKSYDTDTERWLPGAVYALTAR